MVLQPLLLALKGNPQVKYEKKLMYCLFLYFFQTIGYNFAQFLSQDHTQSDVSDFFFFFLIGIHPMQG